MNSGSNADGLTPEQPAREQQTREQPVAAITFYVENLGCAKNQVDAETMISALESGSHRRTETPDEAELLIVNTCGFIEEARRESIDTVLELREKFPEKRIVLAGCLAQREGVRLCRFIPEVDGLFGNRAPGRVPEIVQAVVSGNRPAFFPEEYQEIPQAPSVLSMPGSAYLKIAEGCSNRCSYCSIPLLRGDLRSRPPEEVVADARRYIDAGVVEINLIAQDLASYGIDAAGVDLPGLIRLILEIPGEYWVRMLYIHPDHFPEELLEICATDPRLLPYFDIPFQHASQRILKKMGRTGDGGSYGRLVEHIRKKLPAAVVRSTFLVGFPGEKRADFAELLEFQKAVRFDWLGAFTYSREPGTAAFSYGVFPGLVYALKKRLVQRRLDRILEVQQHITGSRVSRYLGKTYRVFVEERIKGESLFLGRIYAQAPEVDGLTVVHADGLETGRFVRCRIVKVNGLDLEAVPE